MDMVKQMNCLGVILGISEDIIQRCIIRLLIRQTFLIADPGLQMGNKPPGHCVECFIPLDTDEIICGTCQDECDGRWDHLRQIKDEVE